MAQAIDDKAQSPDLMEVLQEALSSGTFRQVKRMLNGLKEADIADLIESSPPKARQVLWHCVDEEKKNETFAQLNEEVRDQFLKRMDAGDIVAITGGLDVDDIADVLQQLPDKVIREVLHAMSAQDRLRVERVLSYDEATAGGLMDTDTVTVRARLTLDVVLRYLRRHVELPAMTDNLFVVNSEDKFVGVLPVTKLLTSDLSMSVREIMLTDVEPIPATMDDADVASLFEKNDWVSAPVVDEEGLLLGRITIDDIVDVIIEDADHSLMSMAGLSEDEDTFAPLMRTTPRRALWLGINLLTVFIAAGVIKQFQTTIEQVVALAILMPIVPSMGGIAGSQTFTLVIRGMALGQLSKNNIRWLMSRELMVGVMNGLLFALIVGVAAYLLFDGDYTLGIIISLAMLINLVAAVLVGALLPLSLKQIDVDPALAGGVILTTVTDVIGFFAFLGLATIFYGV